MIEFCDRVNSILVGIIQIFKIIKSILDYRCTIGDDLLLIFLLCNNWLTWIRRILKNDNIIICFLCKVTIVDWLLLCDWEFHLSFYRSLMILPARNMKISMIFFWNCCLNYFISLFSRLFYRQPTTSL